MKVLMTRPGSRSLRMYPAAWALGDPLGAEAFDFLRDSSLPDQGSAEPALIRHPPSEEPRHVRIVPQEVEVETDRLLEKGEVRLRRGLEHRLHAAEVGREDVLHDRVEEVLFVLEVVVDESLRHTGPLGDRVGARAGEAVLGEDLARRQQEFGPECARGSRLRGRGTSSWPSGSSPSPIRGQVQFVDGTKVC